MNQILKKAAGIEWVKPSRKRGRAAASIRDVSIKIIRAGGDKREYSIIFRNGVPDMLGSRTVIGFSKDRKKLFMAGSEDIDRSFCISRTKTSKNGYVKIAVSQAPEHLADFIGDHNIKNTDVDGLYFIEKAED